MIEVNVYKMRSNEVRMDSLHASDGFIDSAGDVGCIINANLNNFAIEPKHNVSNHVYVLMYNTSGTTLGCRNGNTKVKPCNVKIDFSERARA